MEWKEVTLGELGTIIGGATPSTKNPSFYDGNIPWLTPKDLSVNSNKYILRGERNITEAGFKSCSCKMLPKGSVLFSSRAPIGYVAIAANDMCTNQGFKSIIPNEETDSEFLYYLLKYNKDNIASQGSGTTYAEVSGKTMKEIEVMVPKETEDQRRIASILSSLDRKIELNNKINADLEEMAQAIFKNWFVDFEPFKNGKFVDSELGMIPEGWKVGKITDIGCLITDYVSNGSFASLKQNVHLYETKEYAQFIRNTDLKTNTFSVYVDKHSYDFLSKSTLYGNEIIISNVGDVGSVHLCPKLDIPMTLGNNIIMLRPNEKEYNYFLYLWFKYFSGQGLIQGIKGGSAQPKFNKTDFKNLPLLIPSFEIIEKSYWIFESMFSILSSNVKESSRLSTLRDTLLPRLMSGELEVPE